MQFVHAIDNVVYFHGLMPFFLLHELVEFTFSIVKFELILFIQIG